jgi:hypothetical protein
MNLYSFIPKFPIRIPFILDYCSRRDMLTCHRSPFVNFRNNIFITSHYYHIERSKCLHLERNDFLYPVLDIKPAIET